MQRMKFAIRLFVYVGVGEENNSVVLHEWKEPK